VPALAVNIYFILELKLTNAVHFGVKTAVKNSGTFFCMALEGLH
jgi:hypothetical protein